LEDSAMKLLLTMLAAAVIPCAAIAAPIAVHNTGVNGSNVLVAAGAQASFWTLAAEPAGASEAIGSNPFRYHNPAYFADTATAAWVAPTASGNAGVGGFYTYALTFDLTGLDPTTAAISGIYGTDNDGSISLNGNAPVATTGFAAFGGTTAFSINSGFVAGLNTIDVRMNNGGDPTAFFVQFNSATASPLSSGVPEPATGLPLCLGLLGVIVLSFVRRTAARES
jgi:hypothetical protein